MAGYYATRAQIRYYGPTAENVHIRAGHVHATVGAAIDGAPRRKAPHEYLVGLDLDEWQTDRIAQFTRLFGPLAPRRHSSKALLGGDIESGEPVSINTGDFLGLQGLLRDAWRGNNGALNEIARGVTGDLDLQAHPDGLEIVARDLWALTRLLFLRDYASGKAKLCTNPDCETPYFLVVRRGQKFCSHACAVLINVRRFRERKAKRLLEKSKKVKRR